LISGRPSPQLRYDLERIIATGTNAKVVASGKDADLILDIVSEDSTRQILTYTATGQISAYRLNNRVVFRAFDNTGAEVIAESDIYVIRDLDFTTATVLASDIQQQQFLESMRSDLALQILRRIATLGRVSK
jgi:LPS-assembly lipoprotein